MSRRRREIVVHELFPYFDVAKRTRGRTELRLTMGSHGRLDSHGFVTVVGPTCWKHVLNLPLGNISGMSNSIVMLVPLYFVFATCKV